MVQVMAVVIVVIFAVTHTNQVVAVGLNHVMTVVVATVAVLITVTASLVVTVLALAVIAKVVAIVTQLRVKPMVIQRVMQAVQKDLLAIAHVALVTVQVVTVQVVTATAVTAQAVTVALVTVQVQVRLTVVLVMLLRSVKNLFHVMVQALRVMTAVVAAQMQIVVITAY